MQKWCLQINEFEEQIIKLLDLAPARAPDLEVPGSNLWVGEGRLVMHWCARHSSLDLKRKLGGGGGYCLE